MSSTLEIPITIYGMNVSFIDRKSKRIEEMFLPYRKRKRALQTDFGDERHIEILSVKAATMQGEAPYAIIAENIKNTKITVHKNGKI